VLRRVPSAAVQQLIDRARGMAADQQARDDRVRSLLAEAADARAHDRLDAALALSNQALLIHPDHAEARQLSGRLRQELAAAEAEKARNCERFLERARSALQLEDLAEAERQMQLAVQTGSSNPEIAIVRTALVEARTAREKADALVEEVGSQLALARNEFQIGERTLAIKRLETLALRHPSSTALHVELERLRTEHAKLGAAEQTQSDADRLATEAAAALEKGDAQTATRLAEEALARMPSHEGALRTSAVAHARLREDAERSARQHRAAELIETAKALLARGKFDRAIKEARRAAELDPLGDAHGVISEALRRQASDAAREASEQEAARRATEARALLEQAATALRDKDFPRARRLAERALALAPDNNAPKELIAKIATAAALSVTTLDDDTVNVAAGQPDPDATAVLQPVADGWVARTVSRVRLLFQSRPAKTVNQVAAGRDTNRKEA
jgi:tetratricopeptide (TPR) repeat protein